MRITFLNHNLPLNVPRADHLTEGNQSLFYVDDSAQVVRLSFEASSQLERFFQGNRFRAAMTSASNKWSNNYFYVTKKTSFVSTLKHFGKVVTDGVKSFFKKSHRVYGLSYDNQKGKLFSLIEAYEHEPGRNQNKYSYSKMLTCWKEVGGKITVEAEVSELELLTDAENLFSRNIGKNNKMSQISSLIPSCNHHCSLMVVL